MFAAAHQLEELITIVDYNGWQATGRSDQIMALASLTEKWQAFGFETHEVDGHCMTSLWGAMRAAIQTTGKPSAIIARTVKGKGVSFMEDDNNWHYRVPNDEELSAALAELEMQ